MPVPRVVKPAALPLLACLTAGSAAADPLTDALATPDGNSRFLPPDRATLVQAETLFRGELGGQGGDWESLGLRRLPLAGTTLLVESPEQRQGRGIFAWRAPGAALPWLLQAPHQRDDAHTGTLVRLLFQEQPVQAAMWNSLGRRAPASGGSADQAHQEDTYWQAMTRAFANRYPKGRVIQLHGFDTDKRKSDAAAQLDLILSAGHRAPPAWVRSLGTCLNTRLAPLRLGLYPDQVRELGATTNVQGRLLRDLGHSAFAHLEMSLPVRERLVADPDLRGRLLECLKADAP